MKAVWNDTVLAESDDIVNIEGRAYFPEASLKKDLFSSSDDTSVCAWKGTANYYNVTVNGEVNKNAAWYYAEPSEKAEAIRGRIAFWRGVQVVED